MYCTDCGTKLDDNAKSCPNCNKQNDAVQIINNQIVKEQNTGEQNTGEQKIREQNTDRRNAANNGFIPVNTAKLSGKSTALIIFGIILTVIFGALSVYLFIKLKTELIGWAVSLAILVISCVLQRFLAVKGFKLSMIILSVTIVSVAGTFAFTTELGNGRLLSAFKSNQDNKKLITGSKTTNKASNSANTTNNTNANANTKSFSSTFNSGNSTGTGANNNKEVSSVVSIGANREDLGNIINGQYYFDDGTNRYYSSFDANNAAHIYRADSAGKATPIFDGFGWSLVVNNGWLYFSGNRGAQIDGTYNLFRMRTDGSDVQKLNSGFCYNMSFYKDWLYYIKKSDYSSTVFTFCRSKLDGSAEETVITNGGNCGVVYEDRIYYMKNSGYIGSTKPDGTDDITVIQDPVKYFIIGNGKLIFIDMNTDIKIADTNGSNIKTVKQAAVNQIPYVINSSGDTIYYGVIGSQYVAERGAYQYQLNSIKFDGSGNKLLYSGVSVGCYINIVNKKVYVLDYATDPVARIMAAIAKNMDLDGSNVKELAR